MAKLDIDTWKYSNKIGVKKLKIIFENHIKGRKGWKIQERLDHGYTILTILKFDESNYLLDLKKKLWKYY